MYKKHPKVFLAFVTLINKSTYEYPQSINFKQTRKLVANKQSNILFSIQISPEGVKRIKVKLT